METKKIRIAFFWEKSMVFDYTNLLILNINPICDSILDNNKILWHSKWFYDVREIEISKNKKICVIKIPPWNTIVDILKIMKWLSKNINIIGLAWWISKNLSLWQIIIPNKTYKYVSWKLYWWYDLSSSTKETIVQMEWLVYPHNDYKKLQKQWMNICDMESYELGKICKKFKISWRIIAIISDLPLLSPFYENQGNNQNIKKSIKYIWSNLDHLLLCTS